MGCHTATYKLLTATRLLPLHLMSDITQAFIVGLVHHTELAKQEWMESQKGNVDSVRLQIQWVAHIDAPLQREYRAPRRLSPLFKVVMQANTPDSTCGQTHDIAWKRTLPYYLSLFIHPAKTQTPDQQNTYHAIITVAGCKFPCFNVFGPIYNQKFSNKSLNPQQSL